MTALIAEVRAQERGIRFLNNLYLPHGMTTSGACAEFFHAVFKHCMEV
jgi:hypothetical protein